MSEPLWLEQLQPASWRDMRIHVDSIDVTAGDNTVLREYPFQDLPALFRMGEGAEEIKLSAYVVGDDYHQQRDALRALLHNVPDEGGVLIHPTAGSLRCFVHGKYHIKEAPVAEGGVARFDITFIRAQARNEQGGNLAAVSGEYAALRAADELEQVAIDEFAATWGNAPLEGLPSWARASVADRLKALTDLSWLQAAADGLRDALDFGAAAQAFSSLVLDPSALIAAPLQLARNMAALFTAPLNWADNQIRAFSNAGAQIAGTVFELRHEGRRAQAWFDRMTGGTSSNGGTAVWDIGRSLPASNLLTQAITPTSLGSGGFGLYMYGRGDAVPPSPKQVRMNALTGALDTLVETLATCQALRAATQIPLTNIDQAFALRNAINGQMLRLASNAQASLPYLAVQGAASAQALPYIDALRRAHTASLADLQARSFDLARLTSYTPQTWQPAIYISWRVYGTPGYADEIMAMNPQIANPLLCAPGVALRLVRHD
jgi:prophage DNA circulation protein